MQNTKKLKVYVCYGQYYNGGQYISKIVSSESEAIDWAELSHSRSYEEWDVE